MKKNIIGILAACMMLFVSAACFAKSPKAYYIVDCFQDIIGIWEAEEDGEKATVIITDKYAKAIDSDGEEMSVGSFDELSENAAGIIVAADGSEFKVFLDEESSITFYAADN